MVKIVLTKLLMFFSKTQKTTRVNLSILKDCYEMKGTRNRALHACAPCMRTYLQGESPCHNLMEVKCSEAQGLNR